MIRRLLDYLFPIHREVRLSDIQERRKIAAARHQARAHLDREAREITHAALKRELRA